MALQEDELRKLINCISTSHRDDCIDCETCNQQLDCLAERVARGENLEEILPEVAAHLCCCRDCFEEFDALVTIIRAENGGQLDMTG